MRRKLDAIEMSTRESEAKIAVLFTARQLDEERSRTAAVKAELAAFRALLADRLYALSRPEDLFADERGALQPEDVSC